MDPLNFALLLVPLSWAYMNHVYAGVYGQHLRLPYFWAAHGALLFGKRFRDWEHQPTDSPAHPYPTAGDARG